MSALPILSGMSGEERVLDAHDTRSSPEIAENFASVSEPVRQSIDRLPGQSRRFTVFSNLLRVAVKLLKRCT